MKVEINSKKISEGDTFVAIKGEKFDGHNYINEAIKRGAKFIIAEHGSYDVDYIIVENTKDYLATYLKNLYSNQLNDINLIGITGTNGKTTTAYLLYQALNKLHVKSAYIGTIGFYLENEIRPLEHTTPQITDLYNMFLECKSKNINNIIMEVSSHALAEKRVKNLEFNIGIFTNLTGDHLDYHKTFENYILAKQQLFKQISNKGCAIINNDDSFSNHMINNNNTNITYGTKESNYQILNYRYEENNMIFNFSINDKTYEVTTKLMGKHNIYNLMSVIIALSYMKVSIDEILKIIRELDAPTGRLDVINYKNNRIIIDYAHTVDAVNNVLNTAKEFSRNRIYSIIGCGGQRDKGKRSPMLKSALDNSSKVIITTDNPRNENQMDIVNDMLEGNETRGTYEIILDRKQAIKRGIELLNNDDTLMILGKGHENYQIIGDTKYHHDDKEVVYEFIKKR